MIKISDKIKFIYFGIVGYYNLVRARLREYYFKYDIITVTMAGSMLPVLYRYDIKTNFFFRF